MFNSLKNKKMGTYEKGIIGAFSGKVGPVVGATWRGKDVMRSLPRKSSKPATLNQKLQRDKFTMVTEFLTPLNPIVSRYFGSNTELKTRLNQAMSYTMKEAVTYNDPDFEWEYNRALISRGNLIGLNNGAAAAGAGQSITITYSNNSGIGDAEATDQLVVAVYEPTSKTTLYSLNAGTRTLGTGTLAVPAFLSGLKVHVWATFASADEKKYATSEYLGEVIVA